MGDTIPYGDIIVLGAVALFIILRYRSILGQNSGRDVRQDRTRTVVSFAEPKNDQKSENKPEPQEKDMQPLVLPSASAQSVQALSRIKSLDPDFTVEAFLSGARAAYEMVIEAINAGDTQTLKMLLTNDVYESVDKQMQEHKRLSQVAHTTLVSLKSADITDIQLKRTVAQISVQFHGEQISVVRGEDGTIVEGDVSQVEEVVDEWVLERDVKSRNPNWTIIAT